MEGNEDLDFSTVDERDVPYNIRHRAYYLAKAVIKFISNTHFDKIYSSLFEQLVRSATSIGANLVEGSAGSSIRDFAKFNIIALKSANETKYWLCLIRDTIENVNAEQLQQLIIETDEISKIVASIVIKSRKTF